MRIRRPSRLTAGVALVLALAWTSIAGRVLVVQVPLPSPDVIVSLASHDWERLPAAAAAARRSPRAVVVLTRPQVVTKDNCHDCDNRAARLVHAGVERSRVVELQLTENGTLGEARACRDYMRSSGARSILVVTTPYHTRRALAVFRHELAGTTATVGIEPTTHGSAAQPGTWFVAPFDRWYVAYEWAALAYYALRHGIWPVLDPGASVA